MLRKIALVLGVGLAVLAAAVFWVFRPIPATHHALMGLPDIVALRHFYADAQSSWRYRLSPDVKYIAWLEAKYL